MNPFGKPFKAAVQRYLGRALLACAGLFLLACLGCASFQRRFIYFPEKFNPAKADQLGASARLERWRTPAGEPIGWKRPAPSQPAAGQVLILHGNGICAVQCGHYPDVIQQAAAFDVFIVEYPGYADLPGKPTEQMLNQSAERAFQLLAANGPVYLVGESLGTGVASYLAGLHPDQVAGMVLLAPYNNLTDVAQSHAPILPVRLILCDRFPSDQHLRHYQGPIAMLVGGNDWVVPAKFGRRLYDGYAGPKRLWDFPRGNHGTVMEQPPEVWRQLFAFLNTHRSAGLRPGTKASLN